MRRRPCSLMPLLALLTLGCAARVPIVTSTRPAPQADEAAQPALSVELMEGRPNGLLLRLRVSPALKLPADARLSLWRLRSLDDEEGVPLLEQAFEADGPRRAALEGEGLGVLDAQPGAPDTPIIYILRVAPPAPELMLASAPLTTRWRAPAAAPGALRALADLPGIIEISWRSQPGCQTLIFRRVIDSDDPRPARIAQLPASADGVFVDRDVAPGAVYAYRLACVLEDAQGVPFFGRASGELFVVAWSPAPPEEPAAAPVE